MNSACLHSNRNIAIINIIHLESAAFPRSSKHCKYIILFLLATCKGGKRQRWAIFRKKKTTLFTEVHLDWTGTRPNHPSLVGRELMSHIPKSSLPPVLHHWMPGRWTLPLSESPAPNPWGKMARNPWAIQQPPGLTDDLGAPQPLGALQLLVKWLSLVPAVGIWLVFTSHHLQGISWNSADSRVKSVSHHRTSPSEGYWIHLDLGWGRCSELGPPVALAMGESLQCCIPGKLSANSDVYCMLCMPSLSLNPGQVPLRFILGEIWLNKELAIKDHRPT